MTLSMGKTDDNTLHGTGCRLQRDHRAGVGLLTRSRVTRRGSDVAALLCGLFGTTMAGAGDNSGVQSLAAIEVAAATHVARHTGQPAATAHAGTLDRRLTLAKCDRPLETSLPPGTRAAGRTIVSVRCSGSRPWKVYVPVSVVITADVWVTRTSLPRGHLLTPDDVVKDQRDVSRLPGGYIAEVAQLSGKRLKQPLRAGSVVVPSALIARRLIRRGQTVTLRAGTGSVNIRMTGKALGDGALDQRIRVENMASGRVVEGLVRSAELVEVLVQ